MRSPLMFGWTLSICVATIASQQQHENGCHLPCPVCPDEVRCQDGVPTVQDGCRCCPICARQHGQSCDIMNICDVSKQLVCDVTGTCRGSSFRSCLVNGTSYRDGQTFYTDCRTRCTCEDGSYACTSLCPHEMIRPSRRCRTPTLTEVRGQCCRQWTCADDAPASPPPCEPLTSDWSPCSATCGAGVSTRISNQNRDCTLLKETRLCQIRECPRQGNVSWKETLYQMLRRDEKTCHPTHRSPEFVHLHWQNCTSARRYRPRFCTSCRGQCCRPVATFTRSLAFRCDLDRRPEVSGEGHLWRLGAENERRRRRLRLEPGSERLATIIQRVMWVKDCICDRCEESLQSTSAGLGERSASEEMEKSESTWDKRWEGGKPQQLMGGDIVGDELL